MSLMVNGRDAKELFDKYIDIQIFADVLSIKSNNVSLPLLRERPYGNNWGVLNGASKSSVHLDKQLHHHALFKGSSHDDMRRTIDFDMYINSEHVQLISDFLKRAVDSVVVPVHYSILKIRGMNRAFRCENGMSLKFFHGLDNEVVMTSNFTGVDRISGEISDFSYEMVINSQRQIENLRMVSERCCA
jgi:hypothetical protein